jgi:hypothetical protein
VPTFFTRVNFVRHVVVLVLCGCLPGDLSDRIAYLLAFLTIGEHQYGPIEYGPNPSAEPSATRRTDRGTSERTGTATHEGTRPGRRAQCCTTHTPGNSTPDPAASAAEHCSNYRKVTEWTITYV